MSIETPRTPSEIARETLRRLALEKVAPTPDNYRAFYHRIAGSQLEETFPDRALKLIAAALPRDNPENLRLAQLFDTAVGSRQWPALRQAILALANRAEPLTTRWAALFREVLAQLEHDSQGWTRARKRASLEQVLASAPAPAHLQSRLQGLLKSWDEANPEHALQQADPDTDTDSHAESQCLTPSPDFPALLAILRSLLIQGVGPMLIDHPEIREEFNRFTDDLNHPHQLLEQPAALHAKVRALSRKLELATEDQRGVRLALIGLLKLIVDNIGELVTEDSWLSGQINLIMAAFAHNLDLRVLDEVERRLRDVIDKQGHLKRQLDDVQKRLKEMLSGFVDQLAEFSGSTEQYHQSLEHCAVQIASATSLPQLTNVIEGIIEETRHVRDTARKSGDQLKNLRDQVESANNQIARLQRELDETSELVRHDALTGTLNRKGLDDALEREISRAKRNGQPICITMLDIDNFKHLNDSFGHRTGDEALRHLADVIRGFTRPHDTVGRYGGEEFIIILPETDLDAAVEVITRLQRELTKRFFLAENQRVLITFSAGVALCDPDEDPYQCIDRADKAMYAAKRAGKNRVLVAN